MERLIWSWHFSSLRCKQKYNNSPLDHPVPQRVQLGYDLLQMYLRLRHTHHVCGHVEGPVWTSVWRFFLGNRNNGRGALPQRPVHEGHQWLEYEGLFGEHDKVIEGVTCSLGRRKNLTLGVLRPNRDESSLLPTLPYRRRRAEDDHNRLPLGRRRGKSGGRGGQHRSHGPNRRTLHQRFLQHAGLLGGRGEDGRGHHSRQVVPHRVREPILSLHESWPGNWPRSMLY